jgi:hypothetical protein
MSELGEPGFSPEFGCEAGQVILLQRDSRFGKLKRVASPDSRLFGETFPPFFQTAGTLCRADALRYSSQQGRETEPDWARLEESISLKKTEDRLSANLNSEGLAGTLLDEIARFGSRRGQRDALLIPDTSDIRKVYARKMEYLARVRDGARTRW